MKKLTRKQLALLHVARRDMALHDDDWRAILRDAGGVTSSRDLDARQFGAVLARLEQLGFTPDLAPRGPDHGWRIGMASPEQVAFMRDLWRQYTDGQGDDRSLGKWLDRTIKVSDVKFVTYKQAGRAITALLAMVRRPPPKARKPAA